MNKSTEKKKEKEKAVKDQRKIARIKNKIVRFYVDLYLFSRYLLTAIARIESQRNVEAIKLFAVSKYNTNFFYRAKSAVLGGEFLHG